MLTLLENVADYGCELKDSASGAAVNIGQTVLNAMKDACDDMPSQMAELQSYHDDLFDFQFEFVDTLAASVRASLAGALTDDIEGESQISTRDVIVGLGLDMIRLQKVKYRVPVNEFLACAVCTLINLAIWAEKSQVLSF